MIRATIRLTAEQYGALRERLRREGLSLSKAVRRAVELWIGRPDREARVERSLRDLGNFRSGQSDVSERHDACLAEAFRTTEND